MEYVDLVNDPDVEDYQQQVFYLKFVLTFAIQIIVSISVYNKAVAFAWAINECRTRWAEDNKKMRTLRLFFIFFIQVQMGISYTLIFGAARIVTNNEECFEVLGDAFGIILLNDYDNIMTTMYTTWLDTFHHKTLKAEPMEGEEYMIFKTCIVDKGVGFLWTCQYFLLTFIVFPAIAAVHFVDY